MKHLSIFIDESGDFGPYEKHAPYYLFTLVFHDQKHPIGQQIRELEERLLQLGLPKTHCFHAGPIIRREEDYRDLTVEERRRCLNKIVTFTKKCDIRYQTFYVKKSEVRDSFGQTVSLSRLLSEFIKAHYSFFLEAEQITVYYDNGQVELNKILASVFSALLRDVEFRKVYPSAYRLFQVADLICTLELISLKMESHSLSRSEMQFFGNQRDFQKNYLKPIRRLRFADDV